jgi:hypothetical protein
MMEILKYAGIFGVFVLMIFVVRARRRQHWLWMQATADQEVCAHLRPALAELKQRGHWICRLGMRRQDMPLEIHVQPPFDPGQLRTDLQLPDPVLVSERRVLCCPECWCELGSGE